VHPTTTAAPAADGAVPVGSAPPASRTPTDEAGWTALIAGLYTRRTAAFTNGDAALLAEVYPRGSALLDRDTAALRTLQEAGRTLAGYAPEVRRLESVLPIGGGRVELAVVDDLPGYRVEPAGQPGGSPTQEVPGRGEAAVRVVLVDTPAGWRIDDARLTP
jgi:hypothetical protein